MRMSKQLLLLLLEIAGLLCFFSASASTTQKPGWLQRASSSSSSSSVAPEPGTTNTANTNSTKSRRWWRGGRARKLRDVSEKEEEEEPSSSKGGFVSSFFFFPDKKNATVTQQQDEPKNKQGPGKESSKPAAKDKDASAVEEPERKSRLKKKKVPSAPAEDEKKEASPTSSSKEKKGWRFPFQGKKKGEASSIDEKKGETTERTAKPKESSQAPAATSTVESTTNQTAIAPQTPQQGVIVMGAPAYRVYRPGGGAPAGGMSPQQMQQMQRNLASQNSMVIAEVLSSVLGGAMRLWFFTWVARRLASQEESIQKSQHFVFERLNDRFDRDSAALSNVLSEPPPGVSRARWNRKHIRKTHGRTPRSTVNLAELYARTVVVVEINSGGGGGGSSGGRGDGSSIAMEHMSDVITFLISQQRQHAFGTNKLGEPFPLEIVFLVNSPGGSVASYGLAAAQMQRLHDQDGITTTVCVDKYAASGGYMIASQADKLVAAPFATVGSVGVIVETFNFRDLALRHGVEPLVIKAGQQKNPLTNWGPVRRRDIEQEQQRLEKAHVAFQELVARGRPGLEDNLKEVTDGSVYLGQEAKDLDMIDDVMTSDEYILGRIEAGDRVVRLHRSQQIRYSRNLRLSPLDILPHLRSQLVKLCSSEDFVSRLVQAGTWVGFAHHLIRQYGPKQ